LNKTGIKITDPFFQLGHAAGKLGSHCAAVECVVEAHKEFLCRAVFFERISLCKFYAILGSLASGAEKEYLIIVRVREIILSARVSSMRPSCTKHKWQGVPDHDFLDPAADFLASVSGIGDQHA
jgi:hypothetical protein